MNLRELQLQFKDYLLDDHPSIEKMIFSEQDINAHERLAIYKEGYYRRLIDLLAIDFPKLQLLMADEFETQIQDYLQQFPSQHYLPNYLGEHLATFLSEKTGNVLWQEMAALEYLMIQIADKKNSNTLTLEKLSTLQPEQWPDVIFVLCDHVTMAAFSSQAPFIWQGITENNAASKTDWLIWRKDFQMKLKLLTPNEIAVLTFMQQKKTFAEICEGLCQYLPEDQVANYLMQFLVQCLDDKLIEDVFNY